MATIHDVAKRAGVAISTVSNMINGTKYVSPETTARIVAAIEELGYEADPVARNMKSARSNMIGVIITNFSRVFFGRLLRECRAIATARGFHLMCIDANDEFELEQQYVNTMRKNRFDAIILDTVADPDNADYFRQLKLMAATGKKTAVISIERDLTAYGIDSVEADNYGGARTATRHLLECGCRRLLHITGPQNSWAAENRVRGFMDELKDGRAEGRTVYGDFSPQSGYDATVRALRNGPAFDGVFASNDQMAVGALSALREAGVRVPEDVRVIGFDDSFVASLVRPPLSSVRMPADMLGRHAMELALSRIENYSAPARLRSIETGLVVRSSTDPDAVEKEGFRNW